MSADNYLFITKVKKVYRLCERSGDGDRDFNAKDYKTLEEAVKAAKTRMDEGYYEYGLNFFGDL